MLPVYTRAVSGMQAAQDALDITANNIANVDTPGFDASEPSLADLVYQNADPRDLVAGGAAGTAQGVGAAVEAVSRSGQFGQPVLTGNAMDVTITGDGYFRVARPDGTAGYTRLGRVRVDGAGRLTIAGLLLQPPITLPAGAQNPSITATGQVMAEVNGQAQTIGQIQLTRFPNSEGLQSAGDSTYLATATAGAPLTGTPGQNGFGALFTGGLEAARVDLSREMAALIVTERAFSLNAHALQTVDAMVGVVTHG
jgi:flagellar basal-body rod protein FlgG